MTYATALKPTEAQTCATYPNFNNFQESNGRGWCELFDQQARAHHPKTNNCALNTSPQFTEAFPTEIVWIDREGYPMTEETVENAYFSTDFVTSPNEPF